jgi:retinitis pigmentosa 9 protein
MNTVDPDEERQQILRGLEKFCAEGESGLKDEEVPPEECIPDLPENAAAREFLKSAPTKGLVMPLGKEVKVMQCWRCKAYGHRTGDRECPLAKQGNFLLDAERQAREDPMSVVVAKNMKERQERYDRVEQLKLIVADIRREEIDRLKRKRDRKESSKKRKKDKKEKKEKKEKKARYS